MVCITNFDREFVSMYLQLLQTIVGMAGCFSIEHCDFLASTRFLPKSVVDFRVVSHPHIGGCSTLDNLLFMRGYTYVGNRPILSALPFE